MNMNKRTNISNQLLIDSIVAGEELCEWVAADQGIDYGEFADQARSTPQTRAIEDAAFDAEVRAFDGQFDECPWWGN